MAGRKVVFADGEYYHIFNRGIARQPVLLNKRDYQRFILTLNYYRFKNPRLRLSRFLQLPEEEKQKLFGEFISGEKIVEIICFALMPNHFHLLLKQLDEKGISAYLNKLTNSYTRYFNVKRKRVGDLFQGVFKAVHIEDDEQLLHLSRYIHLNPLVSYIVEESKFLNYEWSSFPDYIRGVSELVDLKIIMGFFRTAETYKKFVLDHADYAKRLEEMKHLTLE